MKKLQRKDILKTIVNLSGGRVHETLKNGLQNQGIEEIGKRLYKTRDFRVRVKGLKVPEGLKFSKYERVLNQEEVLCLVQKYFERINMKNFSEFITIPNKAQRIPQFQFTTHSADKLVPIFLGNTVDQKISLDLLWKVYTTDRIPNSLHIRSGKLNGKLKAIPTLIASEKVGQTTRLALRINKKLLVIIGLALIVILVVAIYLFQKKMREANQKIMEEANKKLMEKANKEILSLKKKIAGCNAEKAFQFVDSRKKIEKIPELEKTVREKTASLKRLMEKINRVCEKNQYVDSECREFDPRSEKELRKIREQWFEDLNKLPEYDDKF